MSARPLPAHPSVRHLRNEAKALLRAVRSGDAEALSVVREHLPRHGDHPGPQVDAAGLSLQKVQHALALAYGFEGWAQLIDHIEPTVAQLTLGDLPRLSRR